MCFGIPGKIIEVWDEGGTRMAQMDAAGDIRRVCLAYLPDLVVGDYTMVHAGFALTRLDEEEALVTLGMMREFGVIADTQAGVEDAR
ncbi:MAG: HypC/HybG/HupF family hydrogenase formation chaperone [Pseudonocardiaceae bacterium]